MSKQAVRSAPCRKMINLFDVQNGQALNGQSQAQELNQAADDGHGRNSSITDARLANGSLSVGPSPRSSPGPPSSPPPPLGQGPIHSSCRSPCAELGTIMRVL